MTQMKIASKAAQYPKIAGALAGATLLLAQAGGVVAQIAAVTAGP